MRNCLNSSSININLIRSQVSVNRFFAIFVLQNPTQGNRAAASVKFPMKIRLFPFIAILSLGCITTAIYAQRDNNHNMLDSSDKWTYHFQFTGIMQWHPAFNAPYRGLNSLNDSAEHAFSLTSTIFLGRKLWKNAAFYFNPEVAGGRGLSGAVGIAGFPNGEVFRVGNPSPTAYVARAFIRQDIKLNSKNTEENLDDEINQVEELRPGSRITITAGKFSLADVYDRNAYSHDPRTDFMNWALMGNGAWDYPANTRGYTSGIIIEIIKPTWAVRFSETLVPETANGSIMDLQLDRARGETLEFEKNFEMKGHKGVLRFLAFRNFSRAGNYMNAISNFKNGTDYSLNINTLTLYGGMKYGFCLNAEQELSGNTGSFVRLGWNDGRTATWMFTEIDQHASLGFDIKGTRWKRKGDEVGIAGTINGISDDHWSFLNFGGYGFIIGDGKLPHYGLECISELYYSCELTRTLWLTADYQFVVNPAYNRDRGPVHVWAVRAHIEF